MGVVLAEARRCLGVPFVPHGRDPETGLDCAGLVLHCYACAGGALKDHGYSLNGRVDLWPLILETGSTAGFAVVSLAEELREGDILALRRPANTPHLNNHVGIFSGYRGGVPFMIHAYDHPRKKCVVESPFRLSLIERVWRLV